eukprot:Hpha_TRINITY_DN23739_c0_g1::TRINITY_DN23739_c0_g1_i1::g.93232::m.93232/K12873/BUD31, G10; bud site selection protein 31
MSRERRWGSKRPPQEFEYIAPTLRELDQELRRMVDDPHEGKRKVEAQWPIHQLNWQKTRYVHDMYHRYKRIPKAVYDYCIKEKLVDTQLISKWKQHGYERLCSTHAVNPRNFNFGTTSICRVPRYDLPEDQTCVESQFNGCRGCASGRGGKKNIFGNKYGQYLGAIQLHREEKLKKGEEVDAETPWATSEEEERLALDPDDVEDVKVEEIAAKRRRV